MFGTGGAMNKISLFFRAAVLAAGTVGTLGGCANFSNILVDEVDHDYHLTVTGFSYTMSMPELTDATRKKANAYCATQDKALQLRWQARTWRPMQVELCFRCVPSQVEPGESPSFPATLTANK